MGGNMKLEIKCYGALCSLEIFKINDIDAYEGDFGDKEDIDRDNAEDYCCGNMQFIPKPATQKILDKYKINVDEYNKVCEKLDVLSFGSCGWCS